jgi:hypothetical protein
VGTQNLMAYSHDPASGRQCAAAPGRMRLSEDCHRLRRSLSRLIRMRLRYRGGSKTLCSVSIQVFVNSQRNREQSWAVSDLGISSENLL